MSTETDAAQGTLLAAETTQDKPAATTEAAPAAKAAAPAPVIPAGDKTSADAKPAAQEIKYELKLPEDTLLDAKHVERIASIAKERGLSQEHAQLLLERESEAVSTHWTEQQKAHEANVESWKKAIETDKEIGGDNFKKSVELGNRVAKKFGTPAFIEALNSTGLGNHPELVRVFARIGKEMGEDKLVVPGAQASAPKAFEDIFYGASKES